METCSLTGWAYTWDAEWGPDIASRPLGSASWQAAGGVGGLLMTLDGTNAAVTYTGLPAPPADPTDDHFFVCQDRLGNITGLLKAAAGQSTLDSVIDYDPFGRELRASGRGADLVPFHFSSKFTDAESGLVYYGFRYYDPRNGRWLNKDPIEELGGLNLSSFVGNNGVANIDRWGLDYRYVAVPDPRNPGFGEDALTRQAGISKANMKKALEGNKLDSDSRARAEQESRSANHPFTKGSLEDLLKHLRKIVDEIEKTRGELKCPCKYKTELIISAHGTPGGEAVMFPVDVANRRTSIPMNDWISAMNKFEAEVEKKNPCIDVKVVTCFLDDLNTEVLVIRPATITNIAGSEFVQPATSTIKKE